MPKTNKRTLNSTVQKGKAGHNAIQVGGDYHQVSNSNNRIIISLVVIVAFGGLAITAYFAKDRIINQNSQPEQPELQFER